MSMHIRYIFLSAFYLMVLMPIVSCQSSKETTDVDFVTRSKQPQGIDYNPNTLIIFYNDSIGKASLMKAVKINKAEVIYDYKIINAVAIKKPEKKTLDETIKIFSKVKGVLQISRDKIMHITDPKVTVQ